MMPLVAFTYPWAAALLLPAALAWWTWGRHGHGRWWRATVLLLIVLAISGPELAYGRGGADVVLVLDRSSSMPETELQRHDEFMRLAAEQRRPGDRLAVVAFGARAAVVQGPQAAGQAKLSEAPVPDSGSELGEALERAAGLIPPGHSARVLVHSDGEFTGLDPRRAGARLAAQGIVLDVLPVTRAELPDAAILDVELPQQLRLGESFIGGIRFISDAAGRRQWRISRGARILAQGSVDLQPLQPITVSFADRPSQPGLATYTVELEGALGFNSAHIDADVLLARLRQLAGSSVLAGIATKLGGDPQQILNQAEKILRTPQGQEALNHMADPVQRAAALTSTRTLVEQQAGALVANYAVSLVEEALSDASSPINDRLPLNNRARAALRVEGGERVLVVGGDGSDGNIARALRAAGIAVTTRAEGSLSLADLAACSALVLDEVPADRLGAAGLAAIGRWVENLGGGLVMTGGRRSFGAGGYRKSPVERVLPVTLELRDEHRKLACSIAIAIDVSGSMQAPAGGGKIKLDLAAEGAAAVIELLGPRDHVAVFAVDSAAKTIIPMSRVENRSAMVKQVLGMQPGGGGIYVYEALAAAAVAVLKTGSGTRHIVLFADASDAEQPGDYVSLLADLKAAGVTVSVIGMGTANDSDAELLKDVARLGGGRMNFAEAPEDIPRLFAQETVLIARSAWIDGPAPMAPQSALNLELGNAPELAAPWPAADGYNLTYARERATVLALGQGDPIAPVVATWRIGTGRSAAVTLDCDDAKSQAFISWPGYGPLLSGLVRWAAGGDDREAPGRLTATRAGRSATLRLELDPSRRDEWPASAPTLSLTVDGAVEDATAPILQPIENGVWEAVIRLDDQRTTLPAIDLAGRALLGPALCLPYAPEAEPRFGRTRGADVLSSLARLSGGAVRSDLTQLYALPPSPGEVRPIAPLILALIILLLISEIAVRRWHINLPRWPRRSVTPVVTSPTSSATKNSAATTTSATAKKTAEPTVPDAPDKDRGLHEALRHLRDKRKY